MRAGLVDGLLGFEFVAVEPGGKLLKFSPALFDAAIQALAFSGTQAMVK